MNLKLPLREWKWLPAARLRQLERANLHTLEDLLLHFPKRYEDRRDFGHFPQDESETPVCICGVVTKAVGKRLRGRMRMFEVTLDEETPHALSTPLICRWFNQYWVEKVLAVGQRVVAFAKPKRKGRQLVLDAPEFEVVEEDEEISIHLRRIAPVHRVTEGLSPRMFRRLVWEALGQLKPGDAPPVLPAGLAPKQTRAAMLRAIHFPESWEALAEAQRYFKLEDFFPFQLSLGVRRREQAEEPGVPHVGEGALMAQLHTALGYQLTGAQQRAIAEIRADMARPTQMNRLLHGDVGAGKTVVALSAMLLAVEAGFQAAVMAPTQVLAEQHYLNFRRLLEPLKISVALRTGARKEETVLPLFDATGSRVAGRAHGPQIVVGTHALLYEGAGLENVGLVVIDEQHKFGVGQRQVLRERPEKPDVLVMTATPIPRTYTMSIYGDLEVSVLDELPKNRGAIITHLRTPADMKTVVAGLRTALDAGRQVYIVYSLVEASEKLEAKAATAEVQKWSELLAPHACDLIHGRMGSEEKERVMEKFRRGETKALVATTVIEVGIDVPNANVMVVEDADRFGMAQLHQLRGRIGRGQHKSYCILLTANEEPEAREKLNVLVRTNDGFEIAKEDMRMRGPGDLLSKNQTDAPPFRLGDLVADAELMWEARTAAEHVLAADPQLKRPEHQHLRELLAESASRALAQIA